MYRLVLAVSLLSLAFLPGAFAQIDESDPNYFPFWIPALDDAPTFTDMSFLSPEPAGAGGRVTIRDGHFIDGRGNRLRLLGSNLTFYGVYPEKEEAPKVAAHLRKLGMNVIRFHHMDGRTAPAGLWLEDRSGFDPGQLDKLDWLIHNLEQNGVYVNLNLHVSRTYPGLPTDLPRSFKFGKGLDNFYPPFIQLQKDYARALLTHTNPYTGKTYAEDPGVFVVEINNENSLMGTSWNALRTLPSPYMDELVRQWQVWIKAHYADTAALRARWDDCREPLGEEMLKNAGFEEGTSNWSKQTARGGAMDVAVVDEATAASGHALKVNVQDSGPVSWSLQVHQLGLTLDEGVPYTLRFRAKADEKCDLGFSVMLNKDPWTSCGVRTSAELTEEWREYTYTFKSTGTAPGHCRLSFNFENRVGQFWIADVSLRRGGLIGLPDDQSVEAGNIPLPPHNAGDAEKEDFYRFIHETEMAYVRDMRAFLREELGVKAAICDTQASYGEIFGLVREGELSDFTDMHSYWQHPSFPGKPWDGNNWYISNTPMVARQNAGCLGSLAKYRIWGKPFTVSEYDHPAPSDYAAEMFPMLASFAAYQDWDGLYQFNYRSSSIGEEKRRLSGYFELWSHPGKQVFLPIAALMFRMGAVSAGEKECTFTYPVKDAPKQAAVHGLRGHDLSIPAGLSVTQRLGLRLDKGASEASLSEVDEPVNPFTSDTGQIVWDSPDGETGVYTVNAPAVRAATGFIGGKRLELGDVVIEVTQAENNWATVAVGALDGKPITESDRILIVAVGRVENTKMGWDEKRTTVGRAWGEPPLLAEGIGASISLPVPGKVHALDGTGAPKAGVEVVTAEGGMKVNAGPQCETLWYSVERE